MTSCNSFDNVELPRDYTHGAVRGPTYSTLISKVGSGAEQRVLQWGVTRRQWDIAQNVKTLAQMQALLAFFHCRMGKARSFLLYDVLDDAVYTVRFDTDTAEIQADDNGILSWPKIPLIEVIGE